MCNCSNPFITCDNCCSRSRCCPCCIPIRGPIGPTGPAGQAATISVGSTTTGDPNTLASVTNSGTSSNAVLNFVIPKGESGNASTINIGTTTTLPAGSSPTVTNVGTTSNAILNFALPTSTTIDSGNFISRTEQNYTTSNSIILLPITLNSNNINISNGIITINKTSRYKIDYGIKPLTSNNTVGIYVNGINIENTNISNNENNNFISSSIILNLNDNDIITLGAVNASQTTPLALTNGNINAYITITSLD